VHSAPVEIPLLGANIGAWWIIGSVAYWLTTVPLVIMTVSGLVAFFSHINYHEHAEYLKTYSVHS